MVGSTISHYRIIGKLGEGGMGVVYRAEDTKLERTVALKFLGAHLLNDEEAKQRFLREAKAAAALSHPNICHVYEIDEVDGKTFISMEFVTGETIEEQIARGPLAIRDALEVACQVALGLEAAHEASVVHRDIKPANILIDAKVRATIMDFGLARLTEASRLTKVDTAMGTVAYMSPEQAQGMEVDRRTDIWAAGCVLYEMVSGLRPFKGAYDQALLYEIVHEEAEPLTSIRAGVPMELEFIAGKCLEKEAASRYQNAGDMAVDLRNLQDKLKSGRSRVLRTTAVTGAVPAVAAGQTLNPAATLPPDAVVMPRSRQRLMQGLLVAAMLAFAGLAVLHFREAPPRSLPTVEFTIAPPEGVRPANLSLSPDGRYLALSAFAGGSLWLRALDSDQWRELPGTVGAIYPFWSPDSTQIGFFADGRLKKITAAGGPPQTVTEANDGRGGSWGGDGTIVFAPAPFGQIQRVSDSGGESTAVSESAEGEAAPRRFPQLLPDGRHFLYADGSAQPGIFLGSLDGGPARRLLADESNHLYVPRATGAGPGLLLFVREDVLVAQPFDAARLEPAGGAIALPANPAPAGNVNNFGFAASAAGLLAYISSADIGPRRLVWVDRAGTVVDPTDLIAPTLAGLRLSPDGTRVAYVSREGSNSDVWVQDLQRATRTRLTDGPALDGRPVWSPEGREVVFGSQSGSSLGMRSADGSGSIVYLAAQNQNVFPSDWSADGRFLLYSWQHPVTAHDIWSLERTGTGNEGWTPRIFLATPSREVGARLSPDGRYVAYGSDESGRFEVYVQPFPEGGQRTTVSTEGGVGPVWSRDGTELFYVTPGDELVAAQVSTEGEFSVKSSAKLFGRAGMRANANAGNNYDVSLDGRRFLVAEPVDGDTGRPESTIHIIQNWQAKFLTGQ